MSTSEVVHALDDEALKVFAEKGSQGESDVPQQGNANAVKVRRVMQVTRDLAAKDFADLRILDLACGEGVYAIEAALRGAEVVAVDGRTERMNQGASIAQRLGLNRIRFEQADIRHVTRATHGAFDVVYLLGILYHLDTPDVFTVLENIRDLTPGMVVIDTHIASHPDTEAEHRGHRYAGKKEREHGDADTDVVRRARALMSLDNTFAFWFTKSALVRLLVDIGFTNVVEVHAPLEPGKPPSRITLIAMGREHVTVSAYPWINGLSEDAIAGALAPRSEAPTQAARPGKRDGLAALVNGLLRKTLGVELRRV